MLKDKLLVSVFALTLCAMPTMASEDAVDDGAAPAAHPAAPEADADPLAALKAQVAELEDANKEAKVAHKQAAHSNRKVLELQGLLKGLGHEMSDGFYTALDAEKAALISQHHPVMSAMFKVESPEGDSEAWGTYMAALCDEGKEFPDFGAWLQVKKTLLDKQQEAKDLAAAKAGGTEELVAALHKDDPVDEEEGGDDAGKAEAGADAAVVEEEEEDA